MAELIKRTDTLNDGREKLNAAIVDADTAKVVAQEAKGSAEQAVATAGQAKETAETVRDQFDLVVAEAGESNPEVVQARGGEVNLNARLTKVTQQLADTASKEELETTSINLKKRQSGLVNLVTKSINQFPAVPNLYDRARKTLLIADDHTKWNRTVQLSTDTVNQLDGKNMVKFDHPAGLSSPYSDITFPSADLSDTDIFEIWLYTSDARTLSNASSIRFTTSTGNYYAISYYNYVYPSNGNLDVTGMKRIRIPKADFVATGSPNWANITGFFFLPSFKTPDAGYVSLGKVDAISVPTGAIHLDFDDGDSTVFDLAFPILNKYGLKGTIYAITSQVGLTGRMTWEQLRTLKEAGWSIANHTDTHPFLNTLTREQVQREFDVSQQKLRDNGFISGSYFLATPGGSWSSICREEAKTRFISARIGRDFPKYDQLLPNDNLDTKYLSVVNTDTVDSLKTKVDEVVDSKQVHHMTFHRLAVNAVDSLQYTPDKLDAICAYIANKRDEGVLIVPTIEEAFLQYQGYELNIDGKHSVISTDGTNRVALRLNRV